MGYLGSFLGFLRTVLFALLCATARITACRVGGRRGEAAAAGYWSKGASEVSSTDTRLCNNSPLSLSDSPR